MLVGLDAAHCVTSTVQAALNRGYEISVMENAVIGETEIEKNDALDEFRKLGVEIIPF
jgi:nicotinamidase-related amidase